jgi:hypothetical protein
MATADTDCFVYQNQEFELVMNTGIDLTAEAGNVQLLIRKPDGTESSVSPAILAPETDGLLQYNFAAGELDQSGDWNIRTYLVDQQTPGRSYVLSVLNLFEKAGYPSALEIRSYLEGYCVLEAKISNSWIAARRDMVVKWLEFKTGIPIGRTQQFTEYLSGTGGSILQLSRKPVDSLDSIEYVLAPYIYAPNLSSVVLVGDEGMLKAQDNFEDARFPMFPKGTYNVKVTYTCGSTVIPDELYEAILALTSEKVLTALANQHGGGSTISTGGYTRNYGNRGKYTDARNELARWGVSLANKFMSGVVGS